MGKKRQKSERAEEPQPEDTRPRILLVYNSVYGNTRAVAEAIAEGLRAAPPGGGATVEVIAAHRDLDVEPRKVDLLIVGGPTHHHAMSDRLEMFVSRLCRRTLDGLRVATFDTRYRLPILLTGSAARDAEKHLRRAGAHAEPAAESFFVRRGEEKRHGKRRHKDDRLEAGEIERAREWGRRLLAVAPDVRPHAA